MQTNIRYSLIASALLFGACLANRFIPRLEAQPLRVLPLARLAVDLGDWHALGDVPVDDHTKAIVPQSRFVIRNYADRYGRAAQVLMQSSPASGEYHSPMVCMPSQGWDIVRQSTVQVSGKDGQANALYPATEIWLQHYSDKMVMLYWYTRDPNKIKWDLLKSRRDARGASCLFTRISVPATGEFDKASETAHELSAALIAEGAHLDTY